MNELSACLGCYVSKLYDPFGGKGHPWIKGGPYPFDEPFNGSSVIDTGAHLTPEEGEILALLKDAWHKFRALEDKHPSDNPEFLDAIHSAQKSVALRVARRSDPTVWVQPGKE